MAATPDLLPELGRRARCCRLTASGRRQFAVDTRERACMVAATGRVMKLA